MRILFDTNIVLDLLFDREQYSEITAELFTLVESETIEGYISVHSLTDIYVLSKETVGNNNAENQLKNLIKIFNVAAVNGSALEAALESKLDNFHDALVYEISLQIGAQGIVTRSVTEFRRTRLPVYTPEELVKLISTRTSMFR